MEDRYEARWLETKMYELYWLHSKINISGIRFISHIFKLFRMCHLRVLVLPDISQENVFFGIDSKYIISKDSDANNCHYKMQYCTRCEETKPLIDFDPSRRSQCRLCRNKYYKDYNNNKKEANPREDPIDKHCRG